MTHVADCTQCVLPHLLQWLTYWVCGTTLLVLERLAWPLLCWCGPAAQCAAQRSVTMLTRWHV